MRNSAVPEAAAGNVAAVLEAEGVAAAAAAGTVGPHAEVDAEAAVDGPVAGAAGVDMTAQRAEGKFDAEGSHAEVERKVAFGVDRGIDAAPAVLAQVAESVTVRAEELVEQDWWHKGRCRSKVLSERRRPGGCCEWYSEWGRMQRRGQVQAQGWGWEPELKQEPE